MRYRVRARRPKAARHVLTLEMLNSAMFGWAREEYVALRDEALRLFADRLDSFEPFWCHERGVPDHLRTLPPRGDVCLLSRGLPPQGSLTATETKDYARYMAEQADHDAVMAGRVAWLDEHPLADRDAA